MSTRTFAYREESAERRRTPAAHALGRVIHVAARVFKRRPDASLVNVKFTDAFERELLERALNAWRRTPK